MSLVAMLVGAALAQAAPAASSPSLPPVSQTPAATTAQAAPAKPNADPVICQSVEATGTHFTTRQCMTKSEWARIARDSQDEYEDLSGSHGAYGMGGPH